MICGLLASGSSTQVYGKEHMNVPGTTWQGTRIYIDNTYTRTKMDHLFNYPRTKLDLRSIPPSHHCRQCPGR